MKTLIFIMLSASMMAQGATIIYEPIQTVNCAGVACDDGNNCTINDVMDVNCNCAGTSSNNVVSGVQLIGNTHPSNSNWACYLESASVRINVDNVSKYSYYWSGSLVSNGTSSSNTRAYNTSNETGIFAGQFPQITITVTNKSTGCQSNHSTGFAVQDCHSSFSVSQSKTSGAGSPTEICNGSGGGAFIEALPSSGNGGYNYSWSANRSDLVFVTNNTKTVEVFTTSNPFPGTTRVVQITVTCTDNRGISVSNTTSYTILESCN